MAVGSGAGTRVGVGLGSTVGVTMAVVVGVGLGCANGATMAVVSGVGSCPPQAVTARKNAPRMENIVRSFMTNNL